MSCENCAFWQDYEDRVFANISQARSNMDRNTIELRRCKYVPPPTVQSAALRYTDKDFACSGWKQKDLARQ